MQCAACVNTDETLLIMKMYFIGSSGRRDQEDTSVQQQLLSSVMLGREHSLVLRLRPELRDFRLI